MAELISAPFYSGINLKAYWQFEGDSLDTTANNHDGTDTSMVYGDIYGKYNKGAYFDGTDAYISITNHANFRPTGDFSVGGWIKTSTASRMIFQSYNQQNSGNQEGFGFYIYIQADGTVNVNVSDGVAAAGSTVISYNSTGTVTSGLWVHWTVTRSGNTWTTYLNGAADGTSTVAKNPAYHASNYVLIGAQKIDVGSFLGSFFSGSQDDTFFCNGTALSLAQIQYLYTSQAGFFLNSY